jgi:leucyl/phenylalanyl-tRNA--protein transferase
VSRVDAEGHQIPEIPADLVGASPPGEPLSAFLTLFYYGKGVFPWLSKDDKTLWWSPQPRAVLFCHELHVNRTLRKVMRRGTYRVTADTSFDEVVRACRTVPRSSDAGSWIDDDLVDVMSTLHQLGHAHSIETWEDGRLVGGLFGLAIGQMFYGCSMYHSRPNASKAALVRAAQQLSAWKCPVIDCAIYNPYLKQMGARLMPRERFHLMAGTLMRGTRRIGSWTPYFDEP